MKPRRSVSGNASSEALKLYWRVQHEGQAGFRWNFDPLAFGYDLRAGSGSSARSRTDRCTLSAARDRPDDRAQSGRATCDLSRARAS